jgi:DnaB helicase-like protein
VTDLRTYYAPELERAIVSLCWHRPENLPKVLQALDPAVHLKEPHLRLILEAINLVYRELGATDWATVIDYLRQQGKLAECGELVGLDEIYRLEPCPALLSYYIELLKDYGALREGAPLAPTLRFNGGQGQIFNNKAKKTQREPDVIGVVAIASKAYELKGWMATDSLGQVFIQTRFYPRV